MAWHWTGEKPVTEPYKSQFNKLFMRQYNKIILIMVMSKKWHEVSEITGNSTLFQQHVQGNNNNNSNNDSYTLLNLCERNPQATKLFHSQRANEQESWESS